MLVRCLAGFAETGGGPGGSWHTDSKVGVGKQFRRSSGGCRPVSPSGKRRGMADSLLCDKPLLRTWSRDAHAMGTASESAPSRKSSSADLTCWHQTTYTCSTSADGAGLGTGFAHQCGNVFTEFYTKGGIL